MTAEANTESALKELVHPVVGTSAVGEERIPAADKNISKYLCEVVVLLHVETMDVMGIRARVKMRLVVLFHVVRTPCQVVIESSSDVL